jgi:hypothetical protein
MEQAKKEITLKANFKEKENVNRQMVSHMKGNS